MSLRDIAKKLYDLGLNVIAVGDSKKPIGNWSPDRRQTWEELEKKLDKAVAVAVVGGPVEGEDYYVFSIDVDNPDAGEQLLRDVFGDDWQNRLCGQPWSLCVLTGPRPKDAKWKCEGEYCERDGERIPAAQVKRGFAVFVRVPKRCVPKGSVRSHETGIELLVRNYQLVAGRHPSGLRYELMSPNYGPGEVISCDETARLVSAVLAKREEDATPAEPPSVNCNTEKTLSDEEVDKLFSALAPLMKARDPDTGMHMHDHLIFAFASVAARNCISHSSTRSVVEMLVDYSLSIGEDNESDAKHHLSIVDWVYRKGVLRGRIWGKKKLYDAVTAAAKAVGENPEEILAVINDVIGISDDVPADRACISIKYIRYIQGDKVVYNTVGMICNKQVGIVQVARDMRKRLKKKEESEEKGEEEEPTNVWTENVLVKAYFRNVARYHDPLIDVTYITADVADGNSMKQYNMVREDYFVKLIDEKFGVRSSPNWRALLHKWVPQQDIIVSGFVCPKSQYKCGIRDYFGIGIVTNPDPVKAREALILLEEAAKLSGEKDAFLTAFVLGAFTNFSLTQRLWGVKPKMVAYVGVKDAGKTVVARLLLLAFSPLKESVLFMPIGKVLTPARIGRLATTVVAATPVVLDEARLLTQNPQLTEVLKSFVSSFTAWGTAHGDSWPSYSGIVMTANQLPLEDPALEEKIEVVPFSVSVPEENRAKFVNEIYPKLVETLPHLGGFYLKLAEEAWDAVKHIIIDEASLSWRKAAFDYFKHVAAKLDYIVELPEDDAPPKTTSYVNYLVSFVIKKVQEFQMQCRDTNTLWSCVHRLLDGGFFAPHMKLTVIQDDSDNEEYVDLAPSLSNAIGGVDLSVLCTELPNAIYVSNKTLLEKYGGKRYKHCLVPLHIFENLFE